MIVDLLKAVGPVVAAIAAAVAAGARWLAGRADSAEARAQSRYDALLAELRDASAKREAYHAAEAERSRADAKALGEALALVRSALERSTAILEAIEPRISTARPEDTDPGRRRTR